MADAIVSQGSKIELKAADVTITIASPGVVTQNAHGYAADQPVVFYTTGALPTGIVAGTTYYVKSPLTNTYNLSATAGGAAINTTGSQSGVHSVYLNVPGIQGTPQLSISNTLVEITDLAATFQEHKATIAGGKLALTLNWLVANAAHVLMLAACVSKASSSFKMRFKDESSDTRYGFSAIVESYDRAATVAGVQQLTVSLTLQSLPTEE